jgi:hypothetical protein
MTIRTKRPRKLDSEWRYVGSAVFENNIGDRVHVGGRLVKMNGCQPFEASDSVFKQCVRIMGTVKRGLMLYSEYYREVHYDSTTP